MRRAKPRIMLTFEEGGHNGGPYVSHERIMNSSLRDSYDFVRLTLPLGRRGVVNPRLVRSLLKQIAAADPDVVHVHGLQLAGFNAAVAARLANKPVVLGVHGSTNEALEFPRWKKRLVGLAEVATLRLAAVVYAVSGYVAGWGRVQKHSRRFAGVVANLPQCIDNGHLESRVRQELGIAASDIVVVSTGRITTEKGYAILGESLCRMGHRRGVTFVIAGDGEFLQSLRSMVEECGLADSVRLLGYRADIPQLLAASDIFVSCSLHETFSMSLLEACVQGLPSVAANVGGVPEIIVDGYNGFLVDAGDVEQFINRLRLLIDHEEERKRMGQNAMELARSKFRPEDTVARLNVIYRDALDD